MWLNLFHAPLSGGWQIRSSSSPWCISSYLLNASTFFKRFFQNVSRIFSCQQNDWSKQHSLLCPWKHMLSSRAYETLTEKNWYGKSFRHLHKRQESFLRVIYIILWCWTVARISAELAEVLQDRASGQSSLCNVPNCRISFNSSPPLYSTSSDPYSSETVGSFSLVTSAGPRQHCCLHSLNSLQCSLPRLWLLFIFYT